MSERENYRNYRILLGSNYLLGTESGNPNPSKLPDDPQTNSLTQ